MKRKLYTVGVFFKVSIKRLFRDRLALFFTFLFPLIFLFVFGTISSGNKSDVSFDVAIVNESKTPYAQQFIHILEKQKTLKIHEDVTTLTAANDKMSHKSIDAAIELPASFGAVSGGLPSGQLVVHYTQNNQASAQTLTTILQAEISGINNKLAPAKTPFTVTSKQNNERSLSAFDYTFSGLIGFTILGAGLFGPINVFPELKKMGILRRLHTTPLRVWQYFLSSMLSNTVIGLMGIAIMFAVAIPFYHIKIVGSFVELFVFLVISIILILGMGLGVGGWAKNERQAAPLAQILVFPQMFLSGTFFPRYIMPHWLQAITNYLPLTPVIDGARLITTEGQHLWQLGPQLLVMAVWLCVIYPIAFKLFRWE